jgi:glycine/D-amino acid oxidase-like deaminating enzyme
VNAVVGVVGGGVMGASLARALAMRDHTVVWWPGLADGASNVPVALLNPHRGRTGRAHPSDLAALATTWAWVHALEAEGFHPGANASGVLRIADGEKQAAAFARHGGPLLQGADVPAPFHAPHGALLVREGGSLTPSRYLAALQASAVLHGAHLQPFGPVAAVSRHSERWRVEGAAGDTVLVDALLLATGAHAWPSGWQHLGPAPAFERHAGDMFYTPLPAPPLPLAGAAYLGPIPTWDGFAAGIGGHHRPPGPTPANAWARLQQQLRWSFPPVADTTPNGSWWGVRAHAPGNQPTIAPVGDGAWVVGNLAGRGFLVAAAVAEKVAVTNLVSVD